MIFAPTLCLNRLLLRRSSVVLGLIALAVASVSVGCGGSNKNKTAAPESTISTETLVEDIDPQMADHLLEETVVLGEPEPSVDTTTEDTEQANSENQPSAGEQEENSALAAAGAPVIVAPDLDLASSAQSDKVARHVAAGWSALVSTPKDPDKAIREAKLALKASPSSVDAVAVLAHGYYSKRLYDTAEVILDLLYAERKAATEANAHIFHTYGLLYEATDRPENALVAYKKAGAINPRHSSAQINLGAFYLRNKQYTAAREIYEGLSKRAGVSSAVVWCNLGSAYRGQSSLLRGNRRDTFLKAANRAYERALQIDRKYAPAYYNLALLYLDASPFPGTSGNLDNLARLERAGSFLAEYRKMPGADADLAATRAKRITKLIKREKKRRKRAGS